MNETKLIAQILDGDTDAYAYLVERYQIGLIIYAERLVGDRAEGEDVAQQAFIKAYQQLSRYDPLKSRFSTWLYKITANTAIDHLRRTKPTVAIDDLPLAAPAASSLIEAETVTEVRLAVARLKRPQLRRVIEAYYWEGQSYDEIAHELNVPINTVKSWMHRAKAQLKENLS